MCIVLLLKKLHNVWDKLKLSTLALNIPTFDKLLDENKKNLKTIDELKATVARLEMEGVDKIKVVAETHTEHEFIEIPCNECVYMASCQEELDFHLENDHDHEESEEPESPDPNTCNICGKRNKNKGELLSHSKTSKV